MSVKKNEEDWEWRATLMANIAEIRAQQSSIAAKLDGFITESKIEQASVSGRFNKLENTVYSLNGQPGLVETVRNLRGKWAALYGGIIIATSMILNHLGAIVVQAFK